MEEQKNKKSRLWRGFMALLIFMLWMNQAALAEETPQPAPGSAPESQEVALSEGGEAQATPAPAEASTPAPEVTPEPVPEITPEPTQVIDPEADQQALKVTSGITPEQMVTAGEATVRINLGNTTNAILDDVTLYDGEGNIVYGPVQIPAGESEGMRSYSADIQVTKGQLSDGQIGYAARYVLDKGTESERTIEKQILIEVKKVKANPKIEFSREISSLFVTQGSEVTLTYRIRNTGNVKLTDIKVTDELGGEVGSLSSLDVGKKKTFTQKVVIQEGQISQPKVSYSYEGGEKTYSEKLKSSEIALAREELVLELSASSTSVTPGETINLSLRLINNGNVSYSKLRISDPVLGDLGSLANDLKAGQEYVFSKEVPIKSSTSFQFHVSGRCATNKEISYKSNICTVSVLNEDQSGIHLRLEAETTSQSISGPGPVTFTLHLYNEGDLDIRDVMLSEQSNGDIKRMAVLAPGETQLEQTYQLTQSGTFVFVAQVSDGQGGSLTVLSNPIEIEVGSGEAAVVASPDADAPPPTQAEGSALKLPENPETFRNMMILAGGVLAIILILALSAGMRSRKKRMAQRKRAAVQRKARPRKEEARRRPARHMPPVGVADKPDEMGDTQRFHMGQHRPTDIS